MQSMKKILMEVDRSRLTEGSKMIDDYKTTRQGGVVYVVVSKEEWESTHKDYKGKSSAKFSPQWPDGTKTMMFRTRTGTTVLAPVMVKE